MRTAQHTDSMNEAAAPDRVYLDVSGSTDTASVDTRTSCHSTCTQPRAVAIG